ncbi:MAG: hypothetical protein GX541_00910 [Clostridiales bacterium]|jgi:hypothetical protein|nr:hypothetical protein [Clostridiales bacterium]
MCDVSGKAKDSLTREQAVTNLVESAARETAALARILSAAGDEIQTVGAIPNITKTEIAELNTSIEGLINASAKLEDVIFKRLELIKTGFIATA